jgi:hypothetical protein
MRAILEPLRPSLDQLHHLVLSTPVEERGSNAFGYLLSAGYQLVPEHEIVYPFDTPEIPNLGAGLFMKLLIITGRVGVYAGHSMVGELEITGSAKYNAGYRMIGTFTNDGEVGDEAGKSMIGVFNNCTFARHPGDRMTGVLYNYGRIGPVDPTLRGERWLMSMSFLDRVCAPFTHAPHTRRHKERFLRDITNPRGLSYEEFWRELSDRYDPWRSYR